MRSAIAALMTLLLVGALWAQDAAGTQDTTGSQAAASGQKSSFAFQGGVSLGSDVLLTGSGGTPQTWTKLGFQPDLSFGKIGVGLDLSLHFMLYPDQNTTVKIFPGDWVPDFEGNGKSVFDVYLPKILYVRYGLKGTDPFFAKLGSIDDLSLGNGFIISNYSNMHFMPQQRIFGLDVGLDGSLFGFPYVGAEALTGNLARFDVVGGRVFARPLVGTTIPILKDMQVGATGVMDSNPYVKGGTTLKAGTADPIFAYGADIMVPILGGKAFPLAAFTDVAIDPNKSFGWMLGAGGRLMGIFTYGAQLRILQDGFIPAYFDANYDIYAAQKYDFSQLPHGSGFYTGWLASLGTSFLEDKFVFSATLDGPFSIKGPGASDSQIDYPHLRGVLRLAELPVVPVYFDASYDKYRLGAVKGFFADLVDPTDAIVGLDINYKTGASVLTLSYDAKWDPDRQEFDVTSSLQASMKF